eukprot:scaffold25820_cov24-Prasinocladus_malaysianus.AAC.1
MASAKGTTHQHDERARSGSCKVRPRRPVPAAKPGGLLYSGTRTAVPLLSTRARTVAAGTRS